MIGFFRYLPEFLRERWATILLVFAICNEPGRVMSFAKMDSSHPICGAVGLIGYVIINSIIAWRLMEAATHREIKRDIERSRDLAQMFDKWARESAEERAVFWAKMRSIGREGEEWKRGKD